jgi:hypothetical protein
MHGHNQYTLILKDSNVIVFKKTASKIPLTLLKDYVKKKYGDRI